MSEADKDELKLDPSRADRFLTTFGTPGTSISQCAFCKRASFTPDYIACAAFQAGIPDPVMMNDVDHRKPIEGDGGYMFVPRDDVAPDVLAWLYEALDKVK